MAFGGFGGFFKKVGGLFGRGKSIAPSSVPLATPGAPGVDTGIVPTAVPVDDEGNPLIPELAGREPTHNERVMIAGTPVYVNSSWVSEFWWDWFKQELFVRFLSGAWGYYDYVPLSLAVASVETDSPGRYIHRYFYRNAAHPWHLLGEGTIKKPRRRVFRSS
jgi:hypothetical protein